MSELDLDLTVRHGLPADVAFLRTSHPPATWPAHANYGELARF